MYVDFSFAERGLALRQETLEDREPLVQVLGHLGLRVLDVAEYDLRTAGQPKSRTHKARVDPQARGAR